MKLVIVVLLLLTVADAQNEFLLMYQEASDKRDTLASLVLDAVSQGQECTYEYITLNVTDLFLKFALYDINNTDTLCQAYSKWYNGHGCNVGKNVPYRELSKTIDILEKATQEIKYLSQNPSLHRRSVPSHIFNSVRESDGYFYSSKTMQPLFTGGYNFGDAEVEQLRPIGQDSGASQVSIASLLSTEWTVNNNTVNNIYDKINDLYTNYGLTSFLALGCNLPSWVIEKYPEIVHYGFSECELNTDHPMILELWKQALTPMIQKLKSNPALTSYKLGNEVYFGVMKNKTAVSNYTIARWHQWLTDKYEKISELNIAWSSSYKSFDEVFFPINSTSHHSLEPNTTLIGGPQWYDYCKFNGDRISDYYTKLIQIIKSVHPEAKIHNKYINHMLFIDYYCDGVDRIVLDSLTDWSSCDTRIMTAPVIYFDTPSRNNGQYALDWLPAAISYTWMRTTTPSKPVIDTEIHAISTLKYRNGSIPDDHMSAVTWLIHLNGIALHKHWFWPRSANGSYAYDIVESFATLPQAVDGYGRSLALVNALGPEVLALANAPKPVCILWSRDSSVQDMDYLMTQIDTFEALFFYGPQPQFVPEPFVKGPETFVKMNCKVLVIPGQRYVSDDIVSAVRSYVTDKKGTVILTGNNTVFQYTPSGNPRKATDITFLKNLPTFLDQDPKKLLRLMESYIDPAETEKIVTCVDSTTNSSTVWGLMCRGADSPDDGKSIIIALVNLLTEPLSVKLYVRGKALTGAKDMYMFEDIDLKSPLIINPLSVRILQAD